MKPSSVSPSLENQLQYPKRHDHYLYSSHYLFPRINSKSLQLPLFVLVSLVQEREPT